MKKSQYIFDLKTHLVHGNILIFTLFVVLALSSAISFFITSKEVSINLFESYVNANENMMLSSSWVSYDAIKFSDTFSSFSDVGNPGGGFFQTLRVPWLPSAYDVPDPSQSYLGAMVFNAATPVGTAAQAMEATYTFNYRNSDTKVVRTCLVMTPTACIRLGGGLNDASPGTLFRADVYERIFDKDNTPSYYITDFYYTYNTTDPTILFFNVVMPLLKPLFQMAYDPLNYNRLISGSAKCRLLYQYYVGADVYNSHPESGDCGLVISPTLNGVSDPLLGKSNVLNYFHSYGIFQENAPTDLRRSHLRPYTMGLIFYLPAGNALTVESFLLLDLSVQLDNSSYFSPRLELRCYTYGSTVNGCTRMTTVSDRFSKMMDIVRKKY